MTFPAGVTTIQVTGLNLRDSGGGSPSGYVTFTPSGLAAKQSADLVAYGTAEGIVTGGVMAPVTILTTDAVSPSFTYTIALRLQGDDPDPPPFTGISIPASLGVSVDLSALL